MVSCADRVQPCGGTCPVGDYCSVTSACVGNGRCAASGDCATGEFCASDEHCHAEGECVAAADCVSGSCSLTGVCLAPGACVAPGDCTAGSFCGAQGTCLANGTCAVADDCPPGQECLLDQCLLSGTLCASHSDCGEGQRCSAAGSCIDDGACVDQSDCGAGLTCAEYACVPRFPCELGCLDGETCSYLGACIPTGECAVDADCFTVQANLVCTPDWTCAPSRWCNTAKGETPVLCEVCNGADEDGDGLIDEGFPDTDGDGLADCVDNTCDLSMDEVLGLDQAQPDPYANSTGVCTVQLPPPRSEIDASCGSGVPVTPPARPWAWTTRWTWPNVDIYSNVVVGDLDRDGTPNVVATFNSPSSDGSYLTPGRLAVLDGVSGGVIWTLPPLAEAVDAQNGFTTLAGPSLGDLDRDGYGDIVAFTFSPDNVVALDRFGNRMWSVLAASSTFQYPVITDLEGDGTVEVVAFNLIIDGATGAVRATLDTPALNYTSSPTVADMDGDGRQEILFENGVYDASGALRWTCGPELDHGLMAFAQPINLDNDGKGELLVSGWVGTSGSHLILCDDDGSVLASYTVQGLPPPIAVLDYDCDRKMEFAVPRQSHFALIRDDFTEIWTAPINDVTGAAGATSWDINLDGVAEVIFADERDLWVFDGATGVPVIDDPAHSSQTLTDTPLVADVDGDGHGEILYHSNPISYDPAPADRGLTLIGSADGDWPYARPVYNQHAYWGGNINDDLSVPAVARAPWASGSDLFRGQPSALDVLAQPNLKVAVTELCADGCAGDHVGVAAQVWNAGTRRICPGVPIELWRVDACQAYLAGSYVTTTVLSPGGSLELQFSTGAAWQDGGLLLVADPDDVLAECNETDNATVPALPCP